MVTVLDLARAGTAPCTHRDEWTSDDDAERAAAAVVCGRCTLVGPCLSAGIATRSTWGIWGGTDFGDPDVRRAQIEARDGAR